MLASFRFLEAEATPVSPKEPVFEMAFGQSVSGDGELKSPSSLAIDDQGHIYVADYGYNRVQKFDPQGQYLWQIDGFEQVRAVAVDKRESLYVLDQAAGLIRKYDPEGTLLFQFGGSSRMQSPSDLAVDKEGKVYVTDTGHRRVQVFDSRGRPLRTFGGPASGEDHLLRPGGIALDGQSNVYVTDIETMEVYIFNAEGNLVYRFGSRSEFDMPKGIAVDEMGYIYVADMGNNRLQVFSPLGESLLYGLGSSDKAPRGRMSNPEAVALDEQGNLYVADTGHDRIQKFRLQTSQDLLANGDFATELKGWQRWGEPAIELREDSVKVLEGDEPHPHILEIQREKTGQGGLYTLGGVGAYQALAVNARSYSSLILKAEVKVIKEDGSNIAHWDRNRQPEGALMIRIRYQDSTGNTGEWYHGFYSGEVKEADTQHFTPVPREKWFSYTSSNLLVKIPDLVTLKELRIYGFGWDFASRISDVRLIAQP
jgi:sugar lactone lactonase YvrE